MNWWRRNWWKTLGVAGVVGVAAGGAAVARKERQRRALTPDEIRERLHQRYDAITAGPLPQVAPSGEHAAPSARTSHADH